jgi:excisionase family DNA binding protein
MDETLVPAAVAAKILNVHKTTIIRWCKSGALANARRYGREWLIPPESLANVTRPKLGPPYRYPP